MKIKIKEAKFNHYGLILLDLLGFILCTLLMAVVIPITSDFYLNLLEFPIIIIISLSLIGIFYILHKIMKKIVTFELIK